MNYEELVHEFLDGSLQSGQEEQLFLSLSASDELRSELKQQLAIRNAVRSDIKALTPRAESTLRIFRELGFSAPIPTPAPTPASPVSFWSKFSGFMGKNTANLMTGIASSVATALLMVMMLKGGIINIGNSSDSSKNHIKTTPVIDSRETKNTSALNNILKENTLSNGTVQIQKEPKIVYKYIYIKDDSSNKNNQQAPIVNENSASSAMPVTLHSDFVPSQLLSVNKINRQQRDFIEGRINSRNIPSPFKIYDLSNPENITHFSAEVNRSTYIYNTQERITPSNSQALSNTSLALSYKFSEEVQVGFEYRNESFYQKFEGFDAENLYAYEQNLNLSSYTLNIRYAPEFLNFFNAKPFVQTSLGGTKVGPIGRVIVGAKINFYDNFSILLSSDYSALGFMHNKNWFLTSKMGMHAGIGLDF